MSTLPASFPFFWHPRNIPSSVHRLKRVKQFPQTQFLFFCVLSVEIIFFLFYHIIFCLSSVGVGCAAAKLANGSIPSEHPFFPPLKSHTDTGECKSMRWHSFAQYARTVCVHISPFWDFMKKDNITLFQISLPIIPAYSPLYARSLLLLVFRFLKFHLAIWYPRTFFSFTGLLFFFVLLTAAAAFLILFLVKMCVLFFRKYLPCSCSAAFSG